MLSFLAFSIVRSNQLSEEPDLKAIRRALTSIVCNKSRAGIGHKDLDHHLKETMRIIGLQGEVCETLDWPNEFSAQLSPDSNFAAGIVKTFSEANGASEHIVICDR